MRTGGPCGSNVIGSIGNRTIDAPIRQELNPRRRPSREAVGDCSSSPVGAATTTGGPDSRPVSRSIGTNQMLLTPVRSPA